MSVTAVMVYADALPTEVVEALEMSSHPWKAVASIEAANRLAPEQGWSAAVVLGSDFERALEFCRLMKRHDDPSPLTLLVVPAERASELDAIRDDFDDFVLLPLREGEFETRLRHLVWKAGGGSRPELVEYGGLVLNLATYQATVNGRPLDMTYMEYELLKHFVVHPGRVHTREELLRQVWGYEYYGGARTVDVHVRRLRAKLGDEHAQLISTVRSVGYIFGRSRE